MPSKSTDIKVKRVSLYFLPVQTRVPLKFGSEILTSVTCARVRMTIEDAMGHYAEGWGETPLSVQWVWPSTLSYEKRHQVLKAFCRRLTTVWQSFSFSGHPLEIGNLFQETELRKCWTILNQHENEPMPWLAALVCCSAFDIALHDSYGNVHGLPIYDTYNAQFMNADLAHYLTSEEKTDITFNGRFPCDFLVYPHSSQLPAWHLVGGKDPINLTELTGTEPRDNYPVLLRDWIRRDGLKCLKIKLRGDDSNCDYDRLVHVGQIAQEEKSHWLTADFNCMVTDPFYVNEILDRLLVDHPKTYGMILYVEQPFPYDLEVHQIDVHSVSARKPLFMDESCHDWRLIRLGRKLGWTGVALKTCKTQTGALLSLCWAKAHGMTLMVQDLTNPMLAQIPHCLLAGHAGTIMGVETNAMQFYPEASIPEAQIHPGLYSRHNGMVCLSTLKGPGFGYAIQEIHRPLPDSIG